MLSVIIPTCNRNDLLSKCLNQLSPAIQGIDKNTYEVIVTDDSKDNIAKALIAENYNWVKWIAGPKKGPASNRNNGAKNSKGEWLVFIDDDCLPEINILKEYGNAINTNPEVLAYEGRIFVDKPQTSFLEESPINEHGGYFWSCNICINALLFKKLEGFDENFPFAAMEDVDFFNRIKQGNVQYEFLYTAAVLHPWRKNNQLYKTILKRYQSDLYYISKYPAARERMTYKYYFKNFLIFLRNTIKYSLKYRFSGFGQKVHCDFLQFYFGLRLLLKLDK